LRRMVAAARRDVPEVAADPQELTVFSGYRDPADDAARCTAEQNCQGLVRAECSAHRTGLAVDLILGSAPGFAADSSDDTNRLYQSRTPAYLWLVANARRYGFVNYVFEPWHWEWTGQKAR
jgi:D-alanyl-D-alanine carboxypeptidase